MSYFSGILKHLKKRVTDYFNLRRGDFKNCGLYLINTPEHGNLGDQAIAIATVNFLGKHFPNKPLIEITHDQYLKHAKYLQKKISKNSVILIHGGGYLGDLWRNEQDCVFDILQLFPCNKIIFLPQTLFYKSPDLLAEDRRVYEKRRNLSVFLRDQSSYSLAKTSCLFNINQIFLCPDIVFSYHPSLPKTERTGILFCIRNDLEKATNTTLINMLVDFFNQQHIHCDFTDTVIERSVSAKSREIEVNKKLMEFSKYKLVITDRLHGMIFSAITGTPCVALDNLSKKVSGAYDWIKEYSFIRYVDQNSITSDEMIHIALQMYEEKGTEIDIDQKYISLLSELNNSILE